MGSYCSVLNDTGETIYVKLGPNMQAFAIAGFVASVIAIAGTFGGATPLVLGVGAGTWGGMAVSKLVEDGYTELAPGGKYTTSKWSLSLVMQASIMKVRGDGVYSGVMTVWTGVTDGSTMEYNASQCSLDFTPYEKKN